MKGIQLRKAEVSRDYHRGPKRSFGAPQLGRERGSALRGADLSPVPAETCESDEEKHQAKRRKLKRQQQAEEKQELQDHNRKGEAKLEEKQKPETGRSET